MQIKLQAETSAREVYASGRDVEVYASGIKPNASSIDMFRSTSIEALGVHRGGGSAQKGVKKGKYPLI